MTRAIVVDKRKHFTPAERELYVGQIVTVCVDEVDVSGKVLCVFETGVLDGCSCWFDPEKELEEIYDDEETEDGGDA